MQNEHLRIMRIDKFLWCTRKFKTRSKATEACKKGQVKLNDNEIKPASEVKVGDSFSIRVLPIWKTYEVLDIPKSRVGAKLVDSLIKETTSWEELEKLEVHLLAMRHERPRGAGRPTKRERRDIDRLKG